MKHILNNLTEEEKNSIRNQHTGGMKIMSENFGKLVNTKSGDVKPLVNEQIKSPQQDLQDRLTQMRKDNFIDPTRATNARGQGEGFYKGDLKGTTVKNIMFGKDKIETGSDEVKKDTNEYKSLVKALTSSPNPSGGKKYNMVITGGASAVGSSSGYDNKALAKRRADKLVQALEQDVPGLNNKFNITTNGVVGKATKYNSTEAYKEQFINVNVELPESIRIPRNIESDNTITTKGVGHPPVVNPKKSDNQTETIICVTLPTGYSDELIQMLYGFKTENKINLTYKESLKK